MRGFNAAAAGAEEIGFVADGEGKSESILRGGCELNRDTVGGTVTGEALALSSRSGAELREFRGDLESCERTSLLKTRDGTLDGLVFGKSLLLERVELIVVENCPPLALGQGILGSTFTPGLGDIPVSGDRSRDPVIVGADRASGRESKNTQREECSE